MVYEKLLEGKPQHKSIKLGILRYYMKLHIFTCVLISPQINTVSGARDAILSFHTISDNVYHCVGLTHAGRCMLVSY